MTIHMNKAVNSLFNCLGIKGEYQGREVLFLLSEPDEMVGIGFAQAHTSTSILKIRVSDAPQLTIGDEIKSFDKTYIVMSEPAKNFNNLVWTVECG